MGDVLIRANGASGARSSGEANLLLQCQPTDAAPLAAAAGIALGTEMLRVATGGGWQALHLAPDEWLLVAAASSADALIRRCAAVAEIPHSLVDVSERSLVLELTGIRVPELLGAGCPLDLGDAALPVGACSRSLFGKATVLLWRTDAERYRLQFARSYATYVTALLQRATADLVSAAA